MNVCSLTHSFGSLFMFCNGLFVSDRSGSTRSNKSNNRGTPISVANSDLLPEKDDICRPALTDANGLLTVDVASTIIPIIDTSDNVKTPDDAKVKVATGKDSNNREKLIVLANNKTNSGPQIIVTTET